MKKNIMLRLNDHENELVINLCNKTGLKVKTKAILHAITCHVSYEEKISRQRKEIKKLEEIIEKRKAINDLYIENLQKMMQISLEDS